MGIPKNFKTFYKVIFANLILLPLTFASQFGPVFPSHDFPTDKSYLVNGWLSYADENSFFDNTGKTQTLDGSLTRYRFTLNPEFQPNRQFAFGAYLNFDSLKLSTTKTQLSKSGPSDQYLYGEFRFLDEPGYSLGFSSIFKFPVYSAPSTVDTSTPPFLLLGDGQIDGSLLLSGEFWPWNNFRLLGDVGMTYRTDDHAGEVPFQLAASYVTPEFNIGLAVRGNFTLNNDKATNTVTSQQIQIHTGATNYVYANSPQVIALEIKGEYDFNYRWGVLADFQDSISGRNSPDFVYFGLGISCRFFEPSVARRSAREVGFETDDSLKEFEGEMQENNSNVEDENIQQMPNE